RRLALDHGEPQSQHDADGSADADATLALLIARSQLREPRGQKLGLLSGLIKAPLSTENTSSANKLGCHSVWLPSDSFLFKSCLSARHGWSRRTATLEKESVGDNNNEEASTWYCGPRRPRRDRASTRRRSRRSALQQGPGLR